jgi:predicted outer membrane protein
MKSWVLAAITSLVTLHASAAASCKAPDSPPTVPNGETASREEMLAAQAAMKSYNAAVTEYTTCVQKDGGSEIELNRIVNQLEKLAVRFNAELRKFKQKAGN